MSEDIARFGSDGSSQNCNRFRSECKLHFGAELYLDCPFFGSREMSIDHRTCLQRPMGMALTMFHHLINGFPNHDARQRMWIFWA